MSKKQRYEKQVGRFFAFPHYVSDSTAFLSLGMLARVLLLDVGRQYNGHNNGHLHITYRWLRMRGWSSNDSIQRAKNELLDKGLIQQTRQGGMNMGPSLFALTWLSIENFQGLDVSFETYQRQRFQDLVCLKSSTDRKTRVAPFVGAGTLNSAPHVGP
jgi:hypothetical protein